MSTVIDRPETEAQVRPARIAVVDDHESVRVGLKAAFVEAGHDFMLAAPNVADLIEGLAGREVDVVVLDLSLGDGSSVTQNVKSVQAIGAPLMQFPVWQTSPSVQALPSSHADPFATAGLEHTPVPGLHVPAPWH